MSTGPPRVTHRLRGVVHRLSTALSTDLGLLLWITSRKVGEKNFGAHSHNARTWAKALCTGLSTGPSEVLSIARCHGVRAIRPGATVRGPTVREGPGKQDERSASGTDTTAPVRHSPIALDRRYPRTSLWITRGALPWGCGDRGSPGDGVDESTPSDPSGPCTGRSVEGAPGGYGPARTGEEGHRSAAPLFSPCARVPLSTRRRAVRSAWAGP